jgi:hypothetical protein
MPFEKPGRETRNKKRTSCRTISNQQLSDPNDLKSESFKRGADRCGLIALDLDGAVLDGAAAGARLAQPASNSLNERICHLFRKIVDDDYGLPAPMRGFPAQNDSALSGSRWRISTLGRS